SSFKSSRATFAPARASTLAKAEHSTPPAPVTTATLPVKSVFNTFFSMFSSILSKKSFSCLLAFLRFFTGLEQPIDIGGAQSAVVQTIAGLSCLAPDHTAMVGTHIAIEAGFHQGFHNGVHIQAAATGEM